MHKEQRRMRQEAPEKGRIGVHGEIELKKGRRLRCEATLCPIHTPRVKAKSAKMPCEAARTSKDLDAEGSLRVDNVVSIAPHLP